MSMIISNPEVMPLIYYYYSRPKIISILDNFLAQYTEPILSLVSNTCIESWLLTFTYDSAD